MKNYKAKMNFQWNNRDQVMKKLKKGMHHQGLSMLNRQ